MVDLIKTSERRQSIRSVRFNAMPESNRYKNVQAFNVVTLWIVAIVLIIKLVTM